MTIQLKPIVPTDISFWIKGTSPLIQHAWTEKGLRQLRMTPQERKKQPKTKRDPETEAMDAAWRTDDGEFGINILAFKASLISAAHKDLGLEKTLLRKSLFVPCSDSRNIVPMECSEPVIREDIVKVGANQTDIRYRPEFRDWRVNVKVQIDSELLTIQDVVNLVNRAGFSVGIGEWRPEKSGEYGRFEVDVTQTIEEV